MNLPSSHIRRGDGVKSLTPSRDLLATAVPKKAAVTTPPTKSKRVRTGCLTCRERHLKCDEGLPDCVNCRKSNRECKRGVRLNFIDTQARRPPCLLPPAQGWCVQFRDESRQIASEYVGGVERYAHLPKHTDSPAAATGRPAALSRQSTQSHFPQGRAVLETPAAGSTKFFPPTTESPSSYAYQMARPTQPELQHSHDLPQQRHFENPYQLPQNSHSSPFYPLQDPFVPLLDDHTRSHAHRDSDASSAASRAPLATGPPPRFQATSQGQHTPDGMMTPPPSEKAAAGERDYLNSSDELFYMQVFVNEVGIWMDSLDKEKHFSRQMPYSSLKSPMLCNAFLACGVKQLTLTNRDLPNDKALYYYDTATTQLLRSLQNPDRNTAECATTAVVLNVYEIMSEKPGQRMRMNHLAGARALIRECGWDARSTGIGAACFWLNMGMEVLSCLASNWQVSWDPDQWGVNMDFAQGSPGKFDTDAITPAAAGKEEEWAQRMFYIMGKIANFRASTPKFQEASPHDEQIRLGTRLAQWQELKRLCDRWNNSCPRTMHPMGYLHASQSRSRSAFPEVWLIDRAAVIGRLCYHTAQCVLAQINPMESGKGSEEMRVLQLHHAHQVCGIVAHTRDRGVSSVAMRNLAIAAAVLTDPREQAEIVGILDRLQAESGWFLERVTADLKTSWGWSTEAAIAPEMAQSSLANAHGMGSGSLSRTPSGGIAGLTNRYLDGIGASAPPTSGSALPAPIAAPAHTHAPGPGSAYNATMLPPAPHMTLSTGSSTQTASNTRGNPLAFADFNLPNHPYQNWYEPPNRASIYTAQSFV